MAHVEVPLDELKKRVFPHAPAKRAPRCSSAQSRMRYFVGEIRVIVASMPVDSKSNSTCCPAWTEDS